MSAFKLITDTHAQATGENGNTIDVFVQELSTSGARFLVCVCGRSEDEIIADAPYDKGEPTEIEFVCDGADEVLDALDARAAFYANSEETFDLIVDDIVISLSQDAFCDLVAFLVGEHLGA